jgi:hypothetical protein
MAVTFLCWLFLPRCKGFILPPARSSTFSSYFASICKSRFPESTFNGRFFSDSQQPERSKHSAHKLGLFVPELGLFIPELGLFIPELGLFIPKMGLFSGWSRRSSSSRCDQHVLQGHIRCLGHACERQCLQRTVR